jgi:hypothetical protein
VVAVGVGAQTVLAPVRRRLPALSATVVLIMGLLSMSGRLLPHGSHLSATTTTAPEHAHAH